MKQWLYSWPSLLVLLIISGFLIHGVWEVYQQERQTRVNKNQRLAHLEELEDRKEALEEEIARLGTARGVEEEIRQKFEVAKAGEAVIVIVEQPLKDLNTESVIEESFLSRFFGGVIFWR